MSSTSHVFIVLAALASVIWHATEAASLPPRIAIFSSAGVWIGSQCYRLLRMTLHKGASVRVCQRSEYDSVTRLTLRRSGNKPITTFPGCYFYIHPQSRLPFLSMWRGKAVTPLWFFQDDKLTSLHNKGNLSDEITILLGQGKQTIRTGQRIRLDGPYGKLQGLNRFETVILVARGLGIAGVLSLAAELAAHHRHDNDVWRQFFETRTQGKHTFDDICRRVNLIWWLDSPVQEEWARKELRLLQDLDTRVSTP
jgi:hypothetical protein